RNDNGEAIGLERKAGSLLRNAQTSEESARIFSSHFERPSDKATEAVLRQHIARTIHAMVEPGVQDDVTKKPVAQNATHASHKPPSKPKTQEVVAEEKPAKRTYTLYLPKS